MPGNTSQIHTPPIQKTLKVIVKPAALFSNAVGAVDLTLNPSVSFANVSGGIVDSYNSSLTAPNKDNGIYTPYPYADPYIVNRSAQAIISGSYLNIQNAVILGYATTANSTALPPSFDTSGTVTSLTSTGATSTFPAIDFSRISNNANQYSFDIKQDNDLPGNYAGDDITINQAINDDTPIGIQGATMPSRYVVSSLSLVGNNRLTISGPVIIQLTGNLTIQDAAKIVVTKGADIHHNGSAQIDMAGNLDIEGVPYVYVADSANDTIRKITPAGVVTTPIGTAGIVGSLDGTGSAAQFSTPKAVAIDGAGNVYVADTSNDTIREITPAGVVITIAGAAGASGSADGTGSAAQFNAPGGVAADDAGNVYVADTGNNTIRKISPSSGSAYTTLSGVVTTPIGTAGIVGSLDGTGSAAQFSTPKAVAIDGAGDVYVADTGNNTIRKITPAGVVTTLAGSPGSAGSADGTGSAALFNSPDGVAVDEAWNVYVADTGNNTIRKITTDQIVTTLAGSPGSAGSADGTGSTALFNTPKAVAVDGAGNVYVADSGNDTIRKITPTVTNGVTAWVVTTLAGSPGSAGSADGPGITAQFNNPTGLALDLGGFKNLTKQPRNLAVFSTYTPLPPDWLQGQKFNTSTPFYGVIYAPTSWLHLGWEDASCVPKITVYGSLVGQGVYFWTTPTIHYDLDLWKAYFSVVDTPYDISKWRSHRRQAEARKALSSGAARLHFSCSCPAICIKPSRSAVPPPRPSPALFRLILSCCCADPVVEWSSRSTPSACYWHAWSASAATPCTSSRWSNCRRTIWAASAASCARCSPNTRPSCRASAASSRPRGCCSARRSTPGNSANRTTCPRCWPASTRSPPTNGASPSSIPLMAPPSIPRIPPSRKCSCAARPPRSCWPPSAASSPSGCIPRQMEISSLPVLGGVQSYQAMIGDSQPAAVVEIDLHRTYVFILGKNGVHTPAPIEFGFNALVETARKELGGEDRRPSAPACLPARPTSWPARPACCGSWCATLSRPSTTSNCRPASG